MTTPLLDSFALDALGAALARYTVDDVHALLGLVGRAAHERGDLAGVARLLPRGDRLADLVRLFLLGDEIDERAARAALHPLALEAATPLLERSAGAVRARLEIRPYADADRTDPWWVVSDFGSDVRPGPLADDHVLGIGAASLTLAQAVARRPARRALDIGTGCGVQALHLAAHAASVVATDISTRALRMAATTAALSGQQWDLRAGSLLDPVRGDQFDLVVANPPFVVSPGLRAGSGGYDYRDSGLAGDAVCAALLQGVGSVLAPGGTASLLANWIIPADGDWAGRVGRWVAGTGCDAWIWQREVVDPGAYVTLWLRDAGELPGSARWVQRYTAWLDWFEASGIVAVGMGLATLHRTDRNDPRIVCEDVPQAVTAPAGTHIGGWFARQDWLARHDDPALLTSRLRVAEGVLRTRHDLPSSAGWRTELEQLRQSGGMRWELEVDEPVAGLVAACRGAVPLAVTFAVMASAFDVPTDQLAASLLPVVRDLIARGFLEPEAAP
ncbi:MAG TPA: methyltransferase [Jatrophihabitantaceae bacterium]|nr:methyltransferase [Jatrophihabitantaceae bacterium]